MDSPRSLVALSAGGVAEYEAAQLNMSFALDDSTLSPPPVSSPASPAQQPLTPRPIYPSDLQDHRNVTNDNAADVGRQNIPRVIASADDSPLDIDSTKLPATPTSSALWSN
jgi:hypothetical protein